MQDGIGPASEPGTNRDEPDDLPGGTLPILLLRERRERAASLHVWRDRRQAKFWLEPQIALASASGFSPVELRRVQTICEEHRQLFMEAWNEFFDQ